MIDEQLITTCEEELSETFKKLEEIALFNQEKVLNAFKKNMIALRHFSTLQIRECVQVQSLNLKLATDHKMPCTLRVQKSML